MTQQGVMRGSILGAAILLAVISAAPVAACDPGPYPVQYAPTTKALLPRSERLLSNMVEMALQPRARLKITMYSTNQNAALAQARSRAAADYLVKMGLPRSRILIVNINGLSPVFSMLPVRGPERAPASVEIIEGGCVA